MPVRKYQKKNQERRVIDFNLRSNEPRANIPQYDYSPPSSPSLHSNEDTIFENRSFVVEIREIEHRRASEFNIADHLYQMSVLPKNRSDIRLTDLFELLNECIIRALNRLRHRYNDELNRQVYATIIDNNIVNGLNAGNYNIKTPAPKIANHLLNILDSYLQSNEATLLNDSFSIQFKVLSVAHLEHMQLHSKTFRSHSYGHSEKGDTKYPFFLMNFSDKCFMHGTNCFPNLCLVLCAIFGMFKLECEELAIYLHFENIRKNLSNRYAVHRAKASLKIHEKLKQYLERGGTITGVIPDIAQLPFLSEHQFHVFDSNQGYAFVESFPPIFSYKKKPIYLCKYSENHLVLIVNYPSFCASNKKFYCFLCSKYFTSKRYFRHLCPKQKVCFACCRPLLKTDYYCNPAMEKIFCDSDLNKSDPVLCPRCNVTLYTEHCKTGHQLICNRGIFFQCCNKYLSRSGLKSTQDELISRHKCSDYVCRSCHMEESEPISISHQCKFKKQMPTKGKPNLAFFYCLLNDMSGSNCYKCQVTSDCHIHDAYGEKESSLTPAYCSIAFKKPNSDSFCAQSFFQDPGVNCANKPFPFKDNYSDFISDSNNLLVHKYKMPQLEKSVKELNMLARILKFILEQKLFNTTFLTFGSGPCQMSTIFKMLIENGLDPKVINIHNRLILIEIKQFQIKFINLSNFIPAKKISDLGDIFFPENIIHQNCIDLNYFPSQEDFFSLTDKIELQERKRKYFHSIDKKKWCFELKLQDYVHFVLQSVIKLTFGFLLETKRFQKIAFSVYEKQFDYYHPFVDSSTKNAYVFKLYQILELNDLNLYCIPNEHNGINIKTSRPENEYVSFLQYKNPDHKMIHAFSPYGQFRNKFSIPDCVDLTTATAFYFQGCFYHSHHTNCKLKKPRATKEQEEKCKTKFNEKVRKMLENCDNKIKTVTEIYGCDWSEQKKTDPEVKLFMETVYVKRPLKRLKPRDVCKGGGRFEVFCHSWTKENNPNEEFQVADIISLYPHIALVNKFPAGKFEIISCLETLQKITFCRQTSKHMLGQRELVGVAMVRIRCPNTYLPYVGIDVACNDETKRIFGTCTKCIQNQSTKPCRHALHNRDLELTLIWPEVNYIVGRLGYELIHVFEIYQWEETTFMFDRFIRLLAHFKLKYSKPSTSISEFCRQNNEQMNFKEDLKLKISDIAPDTEKRNFYKQDLNMILGKFAQKNDKTKSIIIRSQSKLTEMFYSSEIYDIFPYDKACQILISPPKKNTPNRLANCVIHAYVTGNGRISMHEEMLTLVSANCKIYSVQNDCLYFSKPINSTPIKFNDLFGCFRDEYLGKDILAFLSFGCKSSAIQYANEQNEKKVEYKARGFNLTSAITDHYLSFESYQRLFNSKEQSVAIIPQVKIRNDLEKLSLKQVLSKFRFTNEFKTNRVLTDDFDSLPYGYIK